MTTSLPLLVVERVDSDAEHASAELRIGSQPARVQLDLSVPGLVAFEHLPDTLARSDAARSAVIDLVQRIHGGEAVQLPADLSDVVRQASEPWPLRAPSESERDAIEAAAGRVPTRIVRVERDAPETGLVTVTLHVRDDDAVVAIDPRGGQQQPLRFRFVRGLHPWQLSAVEAHAMLLALVTAIRA